MCRWSNRSPSSTSSSDVRTTIALVSRRIPRPPLALHAREVADLYGPPLRSEHIAAELAAIYPQALSQDLARLKALEEDKATLQGLKEGFLTASGGVIRYRGKDLKRADLQDALEEVQGELDRGARNRAGTRPSLPGRACRGRGPARVGMGCVSQGPGRDPSLRRAQRSEPARRARRSLQHRLRRYCGRARVIERETRAPECVRRGAQRAETYI